MRIPSFLRKLRKTMQLKKTLQSCFWILALLPLFFFSGCRKRGEQAVHENSFLNVAVSVEVASLDPQITTSIASIKIQSALFETLVKIDPITGDILPSGAKKWEVSEDGLVYRFDLKEGAKWSDGAPLLASDFEFAFRRLLNPKLGAPFASLFFGIEGARDCYEGNSKALSVRR